MKGLVITWSKWRGLGRICRPDASWYRIRSSPCRTTPGPRCTRARPGPNVRRWRTRATLVWSGWLCRSGTWCTPNTRHLHICKFCIHYLHKNLLGMDWPMERVVRKPNRTETSWSVWLTSDPSRKSIFSCWASGLASTSLSHLVQFLSNCYQQTDTLTRLIMQIGKVKLPEWLDHRRQVPGNKRSSLDLCRTGRWRSVCSSSPFDWPLWI